MPVDDPNSQLAPGENRLHTCQKCHVYAVSNFTDFDPHANFKDAARYPTLHAIYVGIKYTVNIFFACFLLHAFLWFIRALVHRLQHGGHATLVADQYALPRFGPIHRAPYAALIVAFFGLTASGLALKYSDQEWGQWLAHSLGRLPLGELLAPLLCRAGHRCRRRSRRASHWQNQSGSVKNAVGKPFSWDPIRSFPMAGISANWAKWFSGLSGSGGSRHSNGGPIGRSWTIGRSVWRPA